MPATLADFDYELPAELIAQRPADRRDASRLMVVGERGAEHRAFADLPGLLPEGALMIVNDARVVKARVFGRKATGGVVEVVFLEPAAEAGRWRCLARGKGLRAGVGIRVFGRREAGSGPGPELRFVGRDGDTALVEVDGDVWAMLERWGELPLPPYIERAAGTTAEDDERYQTVFARTPGAVAAPTAGLHFTADTLAALERRGIRRAPITLHVGLGTFAPVRDGDLEGHVMHEERYDVPEATAAAHAQARRDGRPIVAVGTTVVRTLESAVGEDGALKAGPGATRLFIRPGHRFRGFDLLVTNFHLPRSTLLMLVSAFAGRERILSAYRDAVAARYRFFSYGDAMLLHPERT